MKLFFVFTFAVGALCVVIPIVLLRVLSRRWKLSPRIFLKAGIAGLLTSLLVLGVTLNIDERFASFSLLPHLAQALILGLVTALFLELGKFLVLDRWLRAVRSRESAVLFGLGWSGLGIIFTGLLLTVGIFGMQSLVDVQDLATAFPNVDTEQMKVLKESQKQVQELVNGPAWRAFAPLLENTVAVVVDIALSLLIVLGIRKKRSSFTWLAVGVRTLVVSSVFFALLNQTVPVEAVFTVWILVGVVAILKLLWPRFDNLPTASS